VALKTTGLLGMMAQAGIPVPAAELFSALRCVSGRHWGCVDEQICPLSAHITNLERISQLADAFSLVLLDELGSATDPEEGAALRGHRYYFLERRAWCLISTHHTSLKLYAANGRESSCFGGFLTKRRWAPTFALRLGVPGLRQASILPSAWA